MVCQDAPYQKILTSQGVLECLTGLPVKTEFINFEDVLKDALSNYDVVLNYGERDNAFVGSKHWENPEVAAKVRAYIYEGGGFIGIGQPSACGKGGRLPARQLRIAGQRESPCASANPPPDSIYSHTRPQTGSGCRSSRF